MLNVLRDYQQKAIQIIKTNFSSGILKQLLVMPTGSGKTVIFCDLLKRCHDKGIPALMVVRGRSLVDQASRRLSREGVPHGVLMANDYRYRLREPIQVISIDTVVRRKLKPKADLIIIDEAHLAVSKSYKEFLKNYNGILGVTATPYPDQGLGHIATEIVEPISFDELVAQGYLIAPRYFAPTVPNLKGVQVQGGEYNQEQLAVRMDTLVGDVVGHYKKLASGRKAVCFAVNIRHSNNLCDAFNSNGIRAIHLDADTPDDKRLEAIERLRMGELNILVNVGIMGLGVDIPCLDCVILARPTRSVNLYIQQIGRATRPYSGKKDFLVLDHAGNILRHGFINEKREAILTTQSVVARTKSPTTCLLCFSVFYGGQCPSCGNVNETQFRTLSVKDGELTEIVKLTEDQKLIRHVQELKKIRKQKGYKRGWLFYELKRTHGEEVANRFCKQTPQWVKNKLTANSLMKS